MEFPGNAITNVLILHDFKDIAYAVCVATNQADDGSNENSPLEPAKLLARSKSRLREAELGIRNLGLLVSCDTEKPELFAFFRKADLQRDGKGIFNRLVAILKTNLCTIADKKAARASDLLNAENARLYRLFMSAVFPSVRSVMIKSHGLIPLGMGIFVYEHRTPEHFDDFEFDTQTRKMFGLIGTRLQLLPSGQLLLSLHEYKHIRLCRPPEYHSTSEPQTTEETRPMLVLAPSGKIARSVNGLSWIKPDPQGSDMEHNAELDQQAPQEYGSCKQELWKSKVEKWLRDHGVDLPSQDQEEWLEVKVPVRTITHSPSNSAGVASPNVENYGKYQTLHWPASMCFHVPELSSPGAVSDVKENDISDPLKFAEDWYLGADARAKLQEERRATMFAVPESNEALVEPEVFEKGAQIDSSPTSYRHTVSEVPFGNNIYPTPPDGALSQVTPGMSSVDGIVATPAEPAQPPLEAGNKAVDEDMEDAMDVQRGDSGVGTGMYDEDLFGDMPDETFGASNIADEPNWDFFDEPDMDMSDDGVEADLAVDSEGLEEPDCAGGSNGLEIIAKDQEDLEKAETLKEQPISEQVVSKGEPASSTVQGDDVLGMHDTQQRDRESPLSHPLELKPLNTPLSAAEVKRTISGEMYAPVNTSEDLIGHTDTASVRRERRESDYGSLHLGNGKISQDDKYSANGRFWFGSKPSGREQILPDNSPPRIPQIGIPGRDERSKVHWGAVVDSDARMTLDVAQPQTPSSSAESDFDSSDFLSNDHVSDDAAAAVPSRKWTDYTPGSPENEKVDAAPQSKSDMQIEFGQLFEYLQVDANNIVMADLGLLRPETVSSSHNSTNDTMIAQILVDQMTQSSLQHGVYTVPETQSSPLLASDFTEDLGEAYGAVENVTLEQLTGLNILSEDPQTRIAKLEETSVSANRDGKPLIASSTILPYWDALAMQPASGRKNVTALCIHPSGSNVTDGCKVFMERLGEVYESCNLGDHTVGRIAGISNDGLVEWSSTDPSLPDLVQTCERIGTALSRLPSSDDTILIYMVNPTGAPSYLLDICAAFCSLFSSYVKTSGKQTPNELALQILPLAFVARAETLAVPAQGEYLTLATEVYNRCPPANAGNTLAHCGSAVVLAEHISRDIDFDLNITAQSPFAKNGKCLHVAYSQSKDQRWITAAWTDESGHIALTMSYCLRQRGSRLSRPISEVIKELWDISFDLMKKTRTKWQVIVARDGHVQPSEVNEWATLANQDSDSGQASRHSLVLLSIDTEPSLSLRVPPGGSKQSQNNVFLQPSGLYSTPSSTPQGSMTSPDQTTIATPTPGGTALNAPTPPDHSFDPNSETDITVSDPTDDSWSVVLPYGLNQSNLILEAHPALASGYLLKRSGATDADNVVALEANLVHADVASPSGRQDLLREILGQYRDLVTLAKTRGMIDRLTCVLPWHVATAIKGQQALSLIM